MTQKLETQVNQPVENPRMSNTKKGLIIGLWGAAITATALALSTIGYSFYSLHEGLNNLDYTGGYHLKDIRPSK